MFIGSGLDNLYLPRGAKDRRTRPYSTTTPFWGCTSLTLDTSDGAVDATTYNPNNPNNHPCGVLVTAMNSSQVQHQSVTVRVWLSDPTTLVARAGRLVLGLTKNTTSMSQTSSPRGRWTCNEERTKKGDIST
jgi:hypothetical protein